MDDWWLWRKEAAVQDDAGAGCPPVGGLPRCAASHTGKPRQAHAYPSTFHFLRMLGHGGAGDPVGRTGAYLWSGPDQYAVWKALWNGICHQPVLRLAGLRSGFCDDDVWWCIAGRAYRPDRRSGRATRREAGAQAAPEEKVAVLIIRPVAIGMCGLPLRWSASMISPVAIATGRHLVSGCWPQGTACVNALPGRTALCSELGRSQQRNRHVRHRARGLRTGCIQVSGQHRVVGGHHRRQLPARVHCRPA